MSGQCGRSFLPRGFGDLDFIHDLRTAAVYDAGRYAFVLNDIRLAFDGRHSVLDVDGKVVR